MKILILSLYIMEKANEIMGNSIQFVLVHLYNYFNVTIDENIETQKN